MNAKLFAEHALISEGEAKRILAEAAKEKERIAKEFYSETSNIQD